MFYSNLMTTLQNARNFVVVRSTMLGMDMNALLNEAVEAANSAGGSEGTQQIKGKVLEIGGGFISISMLVGIIIAVIAMIIGFIGLMLSNDNTRNSSKNKIIFIIIGVVGLVSTVGLISMAIAASGMFALE